MTGEYGIDWDGPVPLEENPLEIPPTISPLTGEQLIELEARILALRESTLIGDKLELYQLAREFLSPQ